MVLIMCIYLIFCIAGKPLTAFSNLPLDSLRQYVGLRNILFWGRYTEVEEHKTKPSL